MTLKEAYERAKKEQTVRALNCARVNTPGAVSKRNPEEVKNLAAKLEYAGIVLEALREKAIREGVNLDGEE